jgi:hypothetical protein
MYCPDCGTENLNGQKFCTRCGTNLKAIESARAVVSEIGEPGGANQLDKASILRTIQMLSILGFFLVTLGAFLITVVTDHGRDDPPIGIFFAIPGFIALVLMVRKLMKMLESSATPNKTFGNWMKTTLEQRSEVPMPVSQRGTTQQLPPVDTMPYSVVEEKTRQFER